MDIQLLSQMEREEPEILQLLRLAAEAILAHPEAVPQELYEQCEDFADQLVTVLNRAAVTGENDSNEEEEQVNPSSTA